MVINPDFMANIAFEEGELFVEFTPLNDGQTSHWNIAGAHANFWFKSFVLEKSIKRFDSKISIQKLVNLKINQGEQNWLRTLKFRVSQKN